MLNIVKHRIVLNDREVLYFRKELLIRVDTRAKHLLRPWRHLAHLLRHLTCGYDPKQISHDHQNKKSSGLLGEELGAYHCHSQAKS